MAVVNKMRAVLTGFGNPLLDTTVKIDDDLLLKKYNLQENGQKEIPSQQMDELAKDIARFKGEISAGGCTQNTCRFLQWFLKGQCQTFIFGSVGPDEEATKLKRLLEKDGVQTRYITQENCRTGRVVALVKGVNRTLVADIGAAQVLPLNDLLSSEYFFPTIETSDFLYIEGFFLTNRWEAAKYIVDFGNKHKKIIVFNTCGEYIFKIIPESIKYLVENSDIVLGNKDEFDVLQKIMNCRSKNDIIKKLNNSGQNKFEHGALLVITNGPDAVECIFEDGTTEEYENGYPLSEDEIKDTTGAGDAFAAGFIAGLCLSKGVSECVKYGMYCATSVIKQTGCTLPNYQAEIPK